MSTVYMMARMGRTLGSSEHGEKLGANGVKLTS